ncbi:MAG: OmpA family protein [Nitrospirota bacterium]|nr:OmpA family protein [Nitrospirota bacterium]
MSFEWEVRRKSLMRAADKKAEGGASSLLRDEAEGLSIGNRAALRLLSSGPAPVVTRAGGAIYVTVYFGQDDFLLDGDNFAAVEKLGEELRYWADPNMLVDGHASQEGTAAYNKGLSEKRRQAVIAILTAKFSGKAKVSGTAYGEAKPAVEETGKTAKEKEGRRARNRRVEIFIASSVMPVPEKKPDLKPKEKIEPESLEKKLERIIKEKPPEPPPKRSLSDIFRKKFDEKTEDILRSAGVPAKYRPYIKDAARGAIEKGAEKILDEALDRAGLGDKEKKAVKSAIKAAGETKF